MQTHRGNNYRGVSAHADVGLSGTGGNQVANAKSGSIPGFASTGDWHPTVLYLIGLLILEWTAFLILTKYI